MKGGKDMNNLIEFITQGSTEWTPSVVVGLLVFCMIFDGFMMCLGNIVKAVKK